MIQQVKKVTNAVMRWFNPEETMMSDTETVIEDLKTMAAEATEPVAEEPVRTEMDPATRSQTDFETIDKPPWDTRWSSGVDSLRASNTKLSTVRGQVDGANQGVREAEGSLASARLSQGAALDAVDVAVQGNVAIINEQIHLLEERKALLLRG